MAIYDVINRNFDFYDVIIAKKVMREVHETKSVIKEGVPSCSFRLT